VVVPRTRGGLEVKRTRDVVDDTVKRMQGNMFSELSEYML
jgi:hypothetical protein